MIVTKEILIIRIAHLLFAVDNKEFSRIQRVKEGKTLSAEGVARLKLVHGSALCNLSAKEQGQYILRFSHPLLFLGIIVDDIRGKEEVEIPEKKIHAGELIYCRSQTSLGEIYYIDICRLVNGEASREEIDSLHVNPEERKLAKVHLKQVQRSEQDLKRRESESKRKRRVRRVRNHFQFIAGTTGFRIGLFLLILIFVSMVGILLFELGKNDQFENIWHILWYIIVTVTTVGYGDKTPVSPGGMFVGLLLMVMGVIVVGAITGQLASFFVDQQMKRRGGLIKLGKIQNHFILCGWRKELEKVIEGILSANPEMDASEIVIINNTSPEEMQVIINNPRFKGIQYVHGDFIEEETLKRANIQKAGRILILADFSKDYSRQEVDSRTVMAVLTIESLTKQVYVSAELLDDKFSKYLGLAHCDEIILSRAYSQLILANATAATGISHVLEDLLSTDPGEGLQTRLIPDRFVNDTFGNVADFFARTYGSIMIGLIENTGNFYKRKKEALNDAQMTPDISKLVENLKDVKKLVPNESTLNPGREYLIKKSSRAIIIGERKVVAEV